VSRDRGRAQQVNQSESSRPVDYALAALSGLLLALSFPSFGSPGFAWIALGPLLVALGGSTSAFLLGLLTGIIYFAGTLYWITDVMHLYGDLQLWTSILINAALVAYLALFPAFFAVAMRRLIVVAGPNAVLAAPLVWVTSELGRTYILTGFPWVLLGYSQVPVLPIAQLASVVGVYGLSALVAFVSAALVCAAGPASSADGRFAFARFVPIVLSAVLLTVVSLWGGRRLAAAELTRSGEEQTFGLIQGNVDQSIKWDASRASAIFAEYLRMTRQAIAQGARVVVWPESSTPFFFEEDRPSAEQIRGIARSTRVPIIVGSDELERSQPPRYYNAAFMVGADGETKATYRKMHLVPFGEYVPLKQLLFFAERLVQAVSDFSPGLEQVLLPLGSHPVSTAICYEIVYPNLVRQGVARGGELLTTITNDAWFGRTSAPHQHFAQASMRAIENGRYLVRAANTGISGIVDPYGRVLARSAIFEPAVIVGRARLLTEKTVYTRIGDAFAYACLLGTAVLLIGVRRRVQ
jgi:apolipoprotein N-acyltransferase